MCLRGRVAPAEVDPLLDEVSALAGVERVENQLVADETLRETAMQRDRRRRSGMRIATPLLALLALASLAGMVRVAAPPRHRPFALFS